MSIRSLALSAPILLVMAMLPVAGHGQGRTLELETILKQPGRLQPATLSGLAWRSDSREFSSIRRGAAGAQWILGAVDNTDETLLADERSFGAALADAGIEGLSVSNLATGRWRTDGKGFEWTHSSSAFRLDLDPLRIRVIAAAPADCQALAASPDPACIAFVRENDVWVKKADGTTTRVTYGGNPDLAHGLAVSRVEFGIKDGLWWDGQGRRLAFYRENFAPIQPYPYVDWATRPAALRKGRYPMAGRRGSIVSVGIYDLRDDAVTWLDTDPDRDEYLTNVTWSSSGDELLVAHVTRAQDKCELWSYSAATGKAGALLITETDEQWVEPESGPLFVPGTNGAFLWFSQRAGYRHLWLHAADGHLLQQVTTGPFDAVEFKGFDADGKGLWYTAAAPDPRQKHLFHASLSPPPAKVAVAADGEVSVSRSTVVSRQVTSGRGQHETVVSPDGRWILDQHSSLELPAAVDLLAGDGKVVRRIHEAADPLASFALGKSEFFTVKSDDGTDLHGHVIWPPAGVASGKHPVLHYVYGGPHLQVVVDRWNCGPGVRNLWLQWMATQGYVVFRLDNRGTPNRGIAFEQAIHRRMGTLEVADQTKALDWILAKPIADKSRVGVHGWSYGGYMTLSLMTRAGDRYRAGVSGAPVTDWALYETGYGERYMDTPEENAEGYLSAAPARHLAGLKGRLLIVQGSSDDTVVWQNTIDFVAQCIAVGVDLDYMVYPGQAHGLTGANAEHFYRKMTAYFARELAP